MLLGTTATCSWVLKQIMSFTHKLYTQNKQTKQKTPNKQTKNPLKNIMNVLRKCLSVWKKLCFWLNININILYFFFSFLGQWTLSKLQSSTADITVAFIWLSHHLQSQCSSGFFCLLTIPSLPFLHSFHYSWSFFFFNCKTNKQTNKCQWCGRHWYLLITIQQKNIRAQSNQAMHTAHLYNHLVSSGGTYTFLLLFSYENILHFLLNYTVSPLRHRLFCKML